MSSGETERSFRDSILEPQMKQRGKIENFEDFYMQVSEDESVDKKYIQNSFMP